ncbi:MAG: tRNA (5-methylaminomethyl-2-thiouridine)(34)-methyltransferase MnmD [Dysgonomonas sp.]|nr:tRNA (5-methylaminomethyl-2-thiouridine)(34)-methyltransferase MnmD [Dysgonomonas sp.]
MSIIIETTLDGSHTLYVSELDEHYHSVNGAIQESMHVFINAGFNHIDKDDIHVLEVGFGTGLNAYLTLQVARENSKKVHYTSFELYPLDKEIVSKLNYDKGDTALSRSVFEELHDCDWNAPIQITSTFILEKINEDFRKALNLINEKQFDLIYFDAFSPDKQPEMWTQEIFDSLYKSTSEGGSFTTYCAKGVVRRMLQSAGYMVERLPGPPGKREMLRAIRK